jgi:hypothetical protein
MSQQLAHRDIQRIVQQLGEANIINLDASIKSLIEPVARSLDLDPGARVSLHILCCNEYAVVTGLTAEPPDLAEIADKADQIRRELG